jgi:hypothetical protein
MRFSGPTDDRIKQEQKDVSAILVEEQGAVAGAVASRTDVVKALEQGHEPVEVFQTDDVAVTDWA